MTNRNSTRLGQILLRKGLISNAQLTIAIEIQAARRKDEGLKHLPISLGEILIEQGFIDRLQLRRGLNWQLIIRKLALVMSFCASILGSFVPTAAAQSSSSSSSSSSKISVTASTTPIRIEAESFSQMSGVNTEPTTDVGGGKNASYLHTNDWMAYRNVVVNIPVAGSYKITYRISGMGGGQFALKNADTNATYDTVNVESTGGFQTWKNIEHIVNLPAGSHSFLISVLNRGNGFNINWFELQSVGAALPVTIQAENYSTMSGIAVETTTDTGGGKNVGYLDANDWMAYANNRVYIPVAGSYKVTYRIAGPGGGKFALKEADGSVTYDTVTVNNTGGFQTWINQERIVTLPQGSHTFMLSIISRGSGFNINWFKIENLNSSSSSSSAPIISSTSSAKSSSSSSVSKSSLAASSVSSAASSAASSVSTQKFHDVIGSASLSWQIPLKRENGEVIDVTELGGYELRYRRDVDVDFTYVTIKDPWQNIYTLNGLSGKYMFQIAAFDKNGLYSNFADLAPH